MQKKNWLRGYFCPDCKKRLVSVYDGRGFACEEHGIIEEDYYWTWRDLLAEGIIDEYIKIRGYNKDDLERNEQGRCVLPTVAENEWLGKFSYRMCEAYENDITDMESEPEEYGRFRVRARYALLNGLDFFSKK